MATVTWPWLMSVLLPPHSLSVPELSLSPGLQLIPWCLAVVGMVTRQGTERELWFPGERWDRLSDSLQHPDRVTAQFQTLTLTGLSSMSKNGRRNRRQERKNSFFFSFCLFSWLSSHLHSLFSTWPHSPSITVLFSFLGGGFDKRDSEVCFIAWSAGKAALLYIWFCLALKSGGFLTSLALYLSLCSLVPPACALFFYLFCGQSRIFELIISGSIAGFSCAPSLGDQ